MSPYADDELGRRLLAVADSSDESDWEDVLKRAGASQRTSRIPRILGNATPRRLAFTAGALAVCVAAIIVTIGGGSSPIPSASAATVLNEAATRTDGYGLAAAIPAGEYWYQKYVAHTRRGATASIEKWISRTGSGRWRTSGTPSFDVRFPTASWAGDRTHSHITFPNHGIWQPYAITGRELTYQQMLRLPTDPDALRQLLAPKSSTPGDMSDVIAFENIGGLLEQPALPANLRGGLFRALALIHNVQRLGSTVVDRQTGAIVGIIQGHALQEIVVNPRTGLLLEGRAYLNASIVRDGAGRLLVRGTLIGDVVLAASGLVNSTSQKTNSICWSTAQPCPTQLAPSP